MFTEEQGGLDPGRSRRGRKLFRGGGDSTWLDEGRERLVGGRFLLETEDAILWGGEGETGWWMGAKIGFKTPDKKPCKWGSQWVAGQTDWSAGESGAAAPDTCARGENWDGEAKGSYKSLSPLKG